MSTLRRPQNFWIPWAATMVLAWGSDAVAQTSYRVTDLGVENNWNLGCAMALNSQGWTESMNGLMAPPSNNLFAPVLKGRAVINIGELTIDLGTLGGENTWMNWNGINDRGEAVGFSETSVPDPNGEDVCGFGTGRTCRPFLWRHFKMSALPTVGGNNGQASAINNRGQIVGFAETTDADAACQPSPTSPTIVPVLWEEDNGRYETGSRGERRSAQPLPTVGGDPDGVAYGINDQGQAVGYSGSCTAAKHAVMWQNGTAVALQTLGVERSNIAYSINNQGQIVGQVRSADGTTVYAALWQPNGALTNLRTLPGDFAAIATGINSRGQVVGSTRDSGFNWVHGFVWQDGVMTDLNTLFPASSNLFVTMANKINDRGQISGMATVLSGPHAGDIHAFLATPVERRAGTSIADVARTQPHANLPANVGEQLLPRLGPDSFER